MKKLLHALLLFFTLFTVACETNNVSKVNRVVKVIGKCCEELSADKHRSVSAKENSETTKCKQNVSSVLPAYIWDTKSIIW